MCEQQCVRVSEKSVNMLQCGSKYKYFVENQYEIGKVFHKTRKQFCPVLAKIYVRILDANKRNR